MLAKSWSLDVNVNTFIFPNKMPPATNSRGIGNFLTVCDHYTPPPKKICKRCSDQIKQEKENVLIFREHQRGGFQIMFLPVTLLIMLLYTYPLPKYKENYKFIISLYKLNSCGHAMQSEKSVMSEFSNAPHDFSSKNVLGRNVVD